MCDIFATPRHWDETSRAIDGRFVIAAAPGQTVCNLGLAVFADGHVQAGADGLRGNGDQPLRHYFAFEVSGRRLLGFKFGIDFTHATGEELATALSRALRNLAPEFARAVFDAQDVLDTLTSLVVELCTQLPAAEVVQTLRTLVATGQSFPHLVHSPSSVPDCFAVAVDVSERFRARDAARAGDLTERRQETPGSWQKVN